MKKIIQNKLLPFFGYIFQIIFSISVISIIVIVFSWIKANVQPGIFAQHLKDFRLYDPQQYDLTFAEDFPEIDLINPIQVGPDVDPVEFLEKWEGYRECAYPDNGVWSIGYGSPAKHKYECITETEADFRIRRVVNHLVVQAKEKFPRKNNNQRAALISLKFNVKPNHSNHVWDLFARGENTKALEYWRSLDMKGTIYHRGLKKRREAELLIFNP